jgi:hypothetical protein
MGAPEDEVIHSADNVLKGRLLLVVGGLAGCVLATAASGEIWPLLTGLLTLSWSAVDSVKSDSIITPWLLGAAYGLAYLAAGVGCFFYDPIWFATLMLLITFFLDDLLEQLETE